MLTNLAINDIIKLIIVLKKGGSHLINAIISAELISAVVCFAILYANNTTGQRKKPINKVFNHRLSYQD